MENGTSSLYFYFTMFEDLGQKRYAFFCLGLVLYCIIVFFNVNVLLVIFLEKTLHEPMYLFISCLSINSLYGTAAVFPRLLIDLLSEVHAISRFACYLQIFIIYTYASYEFTILTLMAYDRYVAICKPLQYHRIMTPKSTAVMIGIVWIYPLFSIGFGVVLSARLPLCGNELTKLYCSNWSVVKLSCTDTTFNNIVGFFVMITTVFIPMGSILFSYVKILMICYKKSSEFKSKAFHTCLPHIVTFVNYSIAIFCEITFSRFNPGEFPEFAAVILSLEFIVIPPVLNPLVYGLNFPEIHRKNVCISQLTNSVLNS
ncbi:putative gustatory receptor clone PTE03 [Chanos chanos]|uniref:Gustatory receptor clone PTE03 n=1 Tax=Chanos chanos TaxID=29144 RepID=A0A6J2VL95_CHACN|nr:putative gustatory receptor clone PTE03 [Chanos chanos]